MAGMDIRKNLIIILTVAALVALGAASTPALAARPHAKAKIIEQTPTGFLMIAKVSGSAKAGHLTLACPSGASLGRSAKFTIERKGFFTAKHGDSWTFKGKFDKPTHFKGSGHTKVGVCGADVPSRLKEPAPHRIRWISCPAEGVATPFPAAAPFQFVGFLPGAALGTSIRLEYTDPGPGITDVVHVRTNAAGLFADTHKFPSTGGEYGADATARFPDKLLSPGVSCGFFIE